MAAEPMMSRAQVGNLAPDFDLVCTPPGPAGDGRARLADYRGRWLALVFYPRDFSLVCPTELTAMSDRIDDFRGQGCELLAVSTDTIESHQRWIDQPRGQGGLGGINFPLASDLDGSTCRDYGVYMAYQKIALRGLFFIDPNGVVQYQVVHNLSVGRRTDEVLRVLAALQTGGLCAENWTPDRAPLEITESLRPGTMFGHYRIEHKLGAGAFAAVYRAIDTTLERPVALKVLQRGVGCQPEHILAEARAAAALNHPNVCTIYGVDDREGAPVIAMEYLHGQPLDQLIKHGQIAPPQAADIVAQVARGLAAAHAARIVHGDLKPGNLFVTRDGLTKVLDFGLARRAPPGADPDATLDLAGDSPTGSLTGTPSYMAPEQTAGQPPTPASDVFSLGAILYELLSGRRAFTGDNILQVLVAIRQSDPEKLAADVPAPFRPLLVRMLAVDSARRTISMSEVADTLASFTG